MYRYALFFIGLLFVNSSLYGGHSSYQTISPDKTKAAILDRKTGNLDIFDTDARKVVRSLVSLPGVIKTEKIERFINGNTNPRYRTFKTYDYCTVQAMRFEDNDTLGLMFADTDVSGEDAENFVYKTVNIATGEMNHGVPIDQGVPAPKNSSFLARLSARKGLSFVQYENFNGRWHSFDTTTGKKLAEWKEIGSFIGNCSMPGWLLKNGTRFAAGNTLYNPDERLLLRRLMNTSLSKAQQEDKNAFSEQGRSYDFNGLGLYNPDDLPWLEKLDKYGTLPEIERHERRSLLHTGLGVVFVGAFARVTAMILGARPKK